MGERRSLATRVRWGTSPVILAFLLAAAWIVGIAVWWPAPGRKPEDCPERHSAACYDDQGKCECGCGIEEFRMWADDQENRC